VITLKVDNRYVRISGADRGEIRKLERITSYRVAGAYYSPAFRSKRWDGREHLLRFSRRHGYRAPAGLLEDILVELRAHKFKYKIVTEDRRKPKRKIDFAWNPDIKLRPYQNEAVEATVARHWLLRGRGILKMPIRSGKTKTAAAIIQKMGLKTLFVVTNQLLLYQSQEALADALLTDVGIIGDSEWIEHDVTVATVQTLCRARGGKQKVDGKNVKIPRNPRYKAMLEEYDLIFFDECHHLAGDSWHAALMDFDAPFRIGLSATAYLENESESERGVIWLKACCGNILIDIEPSRLIREGYLMRPLVKMYPVRKPDLTGRRWSVELHNAAIYENESRNKKIAKLVRKYVDKGMKVLVVTNRLNQVDAIIESLDDVCYGVAASITGRDPMSMRKELIKEYAKGGLMALVGTVFGEGVDIPEIECVINAEGGKDIKATVQKMRNLTPHEGKKRAIFIDFADLTNQYFARHSAERLAVYRSESEFRIKLMR
jgi:superfamily II DNA or RNA helicase